MGDQPEDRGHGHNPVTSYPWQPESTAICNLREKFLKNLRTDRGE